MYFCTIIDLLESICMKIFQKKSVAEFRFIVTSSWEKRCKWCFSTKIFYVFLSEMLLIAKCLHDKVIKKLVAKSYDYETMSFVYTALFEKY